MTQYYFSTSGVTGNSGLSPAAPIPLSKFGAITFAAGDQALFKCNDVFTGTFAMGYSGTSGNVITLGSYGTGNIPVIDAGASGTPVFTSNGKSFLLIQNIEFRNSTAANGLLYFLGSASDIEVVNCYIHGGVRGINAVHCLGNLHFHGSYFTAIADNATHTNGGGSHIQLNNCNGGGIELNNNWCYTPMTAGVSNTPGVGDILSVYQCNGLVGSYILVHDNNVRGGGSNNPAGYCGTVIGDVGGSYQRCYNNIYIDAGMEGAQVQGGIFMEMYNNRIVSAVYPHSNVGIAFGNYSGLPCNNVTIHDNNICWKRSTGAVYNKWWDPAAKTYPAFQPTGWTTNTADSTCSPLAYDALLPNPLWTGTPWNAGSPLVFPSLPTKVYGAADFAPGASGGVATITYTSSNTAVATIVGGNIHIVGAGTSTITATDGTSSLPQLLTVTKAPLTITANNASKTYGTANPAFSVAYSGFVNGDTSSVLTTAPAITSTGGTGSAAGTYPITPSGAAANNYTFTYVNGTLTISKAALTITADNKSRVVNVANPALTASYSGFVNGDTPANLTNPVALNTSATTSSPAGTYAITASGATAANYTITQNPGVLTIIASGLTFPSLPTKNYGDGDFAPGATSSLPITYTSSNPTVATIISGNIHIVGAGTSTITATDSSGSIPQTLTVNKVNLTVTADNYTIIFGSSIPTLTAQYTGFVLGENTTNLLVVPVVTTTATGSSPVGTYPITPAGGSSNNYNFIYVNATLSIIPEGYIVINRPIVLQTL